MTRLIGETLCPHTRCLKNTTRNQEIRSDSTVRLSWVSIDLKKNYLYLIFHLKLILKMEIDVYLGKVNLPDAVNTITWSKIGENHMIESNEKYTIEEVVR